MPRRKRDAEAASGSDAEASPPKAARAAGDKDVTASARSGRGATDVSPNHVAGAVAISEDSENTSSMDQTREADGTDLVAGEQLSLQEEQRSQLSSTDRAGIVLKVEMQNFVCYEHHTIELDPRINFITGKNGSGKSTILGAIAIALGGSPRSTDRGKGVRALIRNGHDGNAVVRVTLQNCGTDAWRPEVYGPSITIERTLRQNSTTSYRIFDSSNNYVKPPSQKGPGPKLACPTPKQELDSIVDHFNILITNPCCILSQEQAKRFLNGSPQDKYNFFLDATLLTQYEAEFHSMQHSTEQIEERKEGLNDQIESLRKDYEDSKRAYEAQGQLAKYKKDVEKKQRAYIWGEVAAREARVEEAAAAVLKAADKVEKDKVKIAACQEEQQQLAAQINNINAKIREVESAMRTQGERTSQAKRAYQQQAKIVKSTANLISKQKRDVQELESHLQTLISELAELKKGAKQRMLDRKAQQKVLVDEAQEEVDSADTALAEARAALDEAGQRCRAVGIEDPNYPAQINSGEVNAARAAWQESQASLRSIKGRMQGQGSSRYPEQISRIIQAVNKARREKRFKDVVFGPLAEHLSLAPGFEDGKWALACEKAFGGESVLTKTFLVANTADSNLMKSIVRRFGGRGVNISLMRVSNASQCSRVSPTDRPSRDVLTVDKVVQVRENFIYNFLVNKKSMHKCALFESWDDMVHQLKRRGVPNVARGYEIEGKRVGDMTGRGYGENPAPDPKVRRSMHLRADLSAALKDAERDLADKQRTYNEAKARHTNEEKKRRSALRLWRTASKTEERADRELKRAQQALSQLHESLEEEMEDDEEEEYQSREDDIQDLQNEIEEKSESVEPLLAKQKDQQVLEAVLKDKWHQIQAEQQNNSSGFDELNAESDALEQKNISVAKKMAALKKKLLLREAQIKQRESIHSEAQAEAATWAEKACRLCGITDPADRSPFVVDAPLEQLSTEMKAADRVYQLQVAEHADEDYEEVTRRYRARKKNYMRKMAEVKMVETEFEALQACRKLRQDKFKKMRSYIGTMSSLNFQRYQEMNGRAGKIKINHNKSSLDMQVNFNANGGGKQVRDAAQMSGGERSYTTLSLLMSLTSSVDSPFSIMDEFDVFMDEMQRKVSFDIMMKLGEQLKHKQFIFITPLGVRSLTDEQRRTVTVFRMPDPRERNRAQAQAAPPS